MTIDGHRLPAIAPAFSASLVVHVALGVALLGVVSSGRPGPADPYVPLAVRLVGSPSPAAAPLAPDTAPVVVTAEAVPSALPTPAAVASAQPSPALAEAEPSATVGVRHADAAATPPPGAVAVRENYGLMSAISPDLASRAYGEFLVEVEKPVRVLQMPDVAYPPEALAAGRQDTVVAWVAIGREGAIDDVVIDSGEPEFAAAVLGALPTARFLPAEERGEIVPFYIVLQFDFRTATATASTVGTAESGK